MSTPTARQRCIVALDVPDDDSALSLVEELGSAAAFYKVGLELFAGGYGRRLVEQLAARGLQVFADVKLYDVPQTVARATRQLAGSGAHFLTIHGDDAIMQAAVASAEERIKILAVTALTSMNEQDLRQLGYGGTISDFVLDRARRAQAAGCAGVICAGGEVAMLRRALGEDFLLVTPGVRRAVDAAGDQKRTATPRAVIAAGGDYLVVGRPIRDAPAPAQALAEIIREIEAALVCR